MTTTVNGDTWNASLVLPNEERSWWIEARAIDEQGRIQAPVAQQRVGVESGLPEGQIIINDGAIATNQLTVTLALLASDSSKVESMRINSGAWIAYTPSFEWGLSEGDGDKTISAQFRDTEGNISDPVADSIILDTAVPTSVITTPPMSLTQRLITLDWTGQDNGSGINFYDIEIRIHETDAWISLLKQTKQTQTTFEVGVDGTHCFRSRAIDIAGNTEVWPAGDGDTCIFVEQQEMLYLPLIAK
jgi:hypothetical protein